MNEVATTESQAGLLKTDYGSGAVSNALSERLKKRKEKMDEEKAATDANAPIRE